MSANRPPPSETTARYRFAFFSNAVFGPLLASALVRVPTPTLPKLVRYVLSSSVKPATRFLANRTVMWRLYCHLWFGPLPIFFDGFPMHVWTCAGVKPRRSIFGLAFVP